MEELRRQLITTINNSNLHIEGVYYIVKDLYREIEVTYNNYLKEQAIEKQKEKEKRAKEENKKKIQKEKK